MSPGINSIYAIPNAPAPRVFSPPPTPQSPVPRAGDNRLSLRLRSNSGIALHTNEVALSQYINYNKNGTVGAPPRPVSFNPMPSAAIVDEESLSQTDTSSVFSLRSRGGTANSGGSSTPIFDFMGRDVLQAILDSPTLTHQLWKYCEQHGADESMEFLSKLQEYTQSINEVASILSTISTQYTSPVANNPLALPSSVADHLQSDMRRVAHSNLPGLEGVFYHAKRHVEDRITRDVMPGFVNSQLAYYTATTLSAQPSSVRCSKMEYPGLGESFCLMDESSEDRVVIAASDALASLSGYSLPDLVSQPHNFLQGPQTDMESVRRKRMAMREKRATMGVEIHHRQNGEPFWNLVSFTPLRDQRGQVRMWLSAQIELSASITTKEELLRALNGGLDLSNSSNDSADGSFEAGAAAVKSAGSKIRTTLGGSTNGGSTGNKLAKENIIARDLASRGTTSTTSSNGTSTSARSRIFSFRTKSTGAVSPAPIPEQRSRGDSNNNNNDNAGSYFGGGGIPGSRLVANEKDRMPSQRFQIQCEAPVFPAPYTYFFLLTCGSNNTTSSGASSNNNNKSTTSVSGSLKMNVWTHSDSVADLFAMAADVTGRSIFQVLDEWANSPSMTRSFKSAVREKIGSGQSCSLEIMAERSRANGSGTRGGMGIGGIVDLKGPKPERMMTHWTPLKDRLGGVQWVMLVISPTT